MVMKMEYKKMEKKPEVKKEAKPEVKPEVKEEGNLKTYAGFVTDISTAGTLMTTICTTDLGTPNPVVQRSSYAAKRLKDAKRDINRMKGQKQGT